MLKLGRILLTSGNDDHVNLISDVFVNLQAQIVDAGSLLQQSLEDTSWIFIDWLLPAMAGIQLVRLLRESGLARNARISMILPEADPAMQSRALLAGADDYIVGPVSPEDLVQRMQIYGAAPPNLEDIVTVGDLVVDTNAYSARYANALLPLNVNEFRLLAHFVRRPNRLFTRSSLIGVLGKSSQVHEVRTVDVWMSRLRRTLQGAGVPHVPRTVRGYGYILDAPAS